MPTPSSTAIELALRLQRECRLRNHRRLLLICGEPEACRRQARELAASLGVENGLWVGGSAPAGYATLDNAQARERLGSELELLIYDAFSGFDPDAFGALGGTLRGGGLLLLLTPSLEEWPGYADPERARLAVEGCPASAVGGAFLQRLASLLQSDPWVVRLAEGRCRPAPGDPAAEPAPQPDPLAECRTADQQRAVEAVLHVAKGHRRRPLVLSSDRGRGKSSALGIAAARLLREPGRRLVVTAPRRGAVDALFEQACRLLPDARLQGGTLSRRESSLSYSAPDHLLAEPRPADLLLVDEAAAIPTALLQDLLAHYPRVVFATTQHGYEGTGRGFDLRFKAHLDRETPQWRELRLQQPIRWAADDPLEPLMFRLLGLDAAPAPDDAVLPATRENVSVERPDSRWLLTHEPALQQLFGLLVLAHYRTTPLDFRLLLDAPNLTTLLLRHRQQVVGVALLSAEGGLDAGLAAQIWAGRRRPKGHLLAQSLAAHVGIADAPCLRGLRIVRIAVHPAVRRRRLGSLLLQRIRELAREQDFDYLGTSFGISESLFGFWLGNGLEPVRLGLRSGTRSGDHSVLMIEPLTSRGGEMAVEATRRFAAQLPALLGDPLRDLSPALAARLLAASAVARGIELNAGERADLRGFAYALRGYETSLPAIERLALKGLGEAGLEASARELLVSRVIQKRGWGECARLAGLRGRSETEARLRLILQGLLGGDDAVQD